MKAVLVTICLVLALSTCRVALAEPSHPDSFRMKNRGGRLYREAVEATTRSMADIGHERNTTPAWWFPQIDPKNASRGTFGQRYFEDRTNATADSNIAMLYIKRGSTFNWLYLGSACARGEEPELPRGHR